MGGRPAKLVLMGMLAVCFAACVSGAAEDLATAVRQVVEENIKATQGEDLEAVLATIHTQAPGYRAAKRQNTIMFDDYDLAYELLSFKLIGSDGDCAVARVGQRTRKKAGGRFQDNDVDIIQIFRKEDGQWKFWTQAVIEVKYLER